MNGAGPVVCVLARRGKTLSAEPFFETGGGGRGRGIALGKSRPDHARPGDLVLVALGRRGAGHGKVLRRIGRPDVARDVLEALMFDRGLRRRFDPLVERRAREAAGDARALDVARRDLRDLPTFTIDPPSAKDFDDAISAEVLPDGTTRIWIHIADVCAHVRPGDAVDREAARRATSVYVPGLVEPMLPEALSNVACSLVPGDDRLSVTVELDFAPGAATPRRAAFLRSMIRSDARLDYPRVDRIFAGAERAQAPWAEPLTAARRVAQALQAARDARGALAVESSEPEFSFARDGNVTGVEPSVQTESHRLIEHLMIAANEAVAGFLDARGVPALYRVHERPDPARVEHLVAQLDALGVPTPPLPATLTPQAAVDAIGPLSHAVDAEVRRRGHGRAGLTSLVLRSLKQARYSERNLGHSGLRSERYCHFTSPIRRYPDLICHRALLAALNLGEEAPTAPEVQGAAEWCSTRERGAMAIERAADDVARAFLLELELARGGGALREFGGEVTGVIAAGAFVAFGDGYEGMLHVRRLHGYWELDETETALAGPRSHPPGRLRIGDPLVVQVARVDTARGRVDLSPVELTLR